MNFSNQFIDTIIDIESDGDVSQPRELKVKELQFGHIAIDPTRPIADFEARGFNWKYLAGELAWYLKRQRRRLHWPVFRVLVYSNESRY